MTNKKSVKASNAPRPGITSKVQKAKIKDATDPKDWIDALAENKMLQGINRPAPIAKQVTLKLGVQEWAQIASGAAIYGWTVSEAVQFLFEAHMDCLDWFNDEFALSGKHWMIRNSSHRPLHQEAAVSGKEKA